MLHGLVLWRLLYYLPIYYEIVKGFSRIHAGLGILPETASLVPASIITGQLVTTLGMGLLRLLDVGTLVSLWVGLNLVVGVCTGMLFGAMAFAVRASVASELLASAVSMFSFFRSLGAVC
jgi:hypothetical protein